MITRLDRLQGRDIYEKQIDELQMKVNKLTPNISFAQPEVKEKYNELSMRLNEPIPTKIFWGYPDTVEMKDKDGKVHTYSIIELLDGLQRIARAEQKD